MIIKRITTFTLRAPIAEQTFYSSQARFPERNSLLVKVETNNGLIGWGEGGQYGPPSPVAACINDVFAPLLVSARADQPVKTWEQLYAFSRDFGRQSAYVEAISALDIALWDVWGQSLGQPIHALLGGAFRDRVIAYATGGYYGADYRDHARSLAALEQEMAGYAANGFAIVKMKVGLLPVEADAERLAVARRALGPQVKLLVDANHAYNAATAIRIGRELERHGVLWFEEPVVPEDRSGYRTVREALSIPIAGGECEYTRYGFRDLFLGQCVDIAQPDLCVCGGFSEWLKIQALASSFGVVTIPHVWGSGIALAAALHALAAMPPTPHTANPIALQNEPVVEFDRTHNPLRDELLGDKFISNDGALTVPKRPGLGIRIDESIVGKYGAQR
jgi:D-galactarolactone cycloisomerase